jgi:hypothetical protein
MKATLHDVMDGINDYVRCPEDFFGVLQVLRRKADAIGYSCRNNDNLPLSAWWADSERALKDAEDTTRANYTATAEGR